MLTYRQILFFLVISLLLYCRRSEHCVTSSHCFCVQVTQFRKYKSWNPKPGNCFELISNLLLSYWESQSKGSSNRLLIKSRSLGVSGFVLLKIFTCTTWHQSYWFLDISLETCLFQLLWLLKSLNHILLFFASFDFFCGSNTVHRISGCTSHTMHFMDAPLFSNLGFFSFLLQSKRPGMVVASWPLDILIGQ